MSPYWFSSRMLRQIAYLFTSLSYTILLEDLHGKKKWSQKHGNLVHSQKRASCSRSAVMQLAIIKPISRMRSHRLLRFDNIKSVASCQQTWCKLWTAGLMQVVNCRLDASCELQTWCKLWTAGLMQVVNCRLDAICELQTWCKLWTADLMQVVNCRLDASCHPQTWCKLSSTDLMQVVKRLSEESALWSFVYVLFWTKNGQTVCHISVVVFRKITRLLYNQLAR
jgi:hypothetical protein